MKNEKKQKLGPHQKAWIKALKSGKYPQTIESLRDDKGFCCLGVCCMVAIKGGMPLKVKENHDNNQWSFSGHTSVLPKKVQKYFGFFGEEGPCRNVNESTLIDMNDEEGLSFKDIASVVEKTPENFFKEEL